MTEDNQLLHTGEIDPVHGQHGGQAWSSEMDVEGTDVWIQFEFPRVYFISHIILWNFMSWYEEKNEFGVTQREDDSYSALSAFDVSYSLDGACGPARVQECARFAKVLDWVCRGVLQLLARF